MALQTVNIGNFANDGTGDDLRTAFFKVNANFEELDLQGGQANTISNIGVGIGLFKEKIGVDLRLKTLIAGSGITLTNNANDITITNNRNMIITVNANTGTLTASTPNQAINILGGTGVQTNIVGNTLTISASSFTLNSDLSPSLAGNLNLNGFDIIGGAESSITANSFIGNLTGLVNNINITQLYNDYYNFDFGGITQTFTSPIIYILNSGLIDMGSFIAPNITVIDGGPFI